MENIFNLGALLIGQDWHEGCTLLSAIESCQVPVSVARDLSEAKVLVDRRNFDFVVVDGGDQREVATAITTLRGTKLNRRAFIIAVMNTIPASAEAGLMQADYYLEKPVRSQAVYDVIRSATTISCGEKRELDRTSVLFSTTLIRNSSEPVRAMVVDLSSNGIRVVVKENLRTHEPIELDLALPQTAKPIRVTGRVAWRDSHGQTGIQFTYISPADFNRLRRWITRGAPTAIRNESLPVEHIPASPSDLAGSTRDLRFCVDRMIDAVDRATRLNSAGRTSS